LDPATVRVSPAQAVDALKPSHPPEQIRLNTFDGRPVYRIRAGRAEQIVYADTGTARVDVSRDVMARVAAAWTGQPAAAATVEPIDVGSVDGARIVSQPETALEVLMARTGSRSTSRRSPERSCNTPRGPRAWAPTLDRFRTGCISRRSANTSSPGVASSSGRRYRDRRRDCRPRNRRLDVFAGEALSLSGWHDEHPVSGTEALAHGARSHLRDRCRDLGVQRHALDGSVPTHASRRPRRHSSRASRRHSDRGALDEPYRVCSRACTTNVSKSSS
jgi:hypothetical protein